VGTATAELGQAVYHNANGVGAVPNALHSAARYTSDFRPPDPALNFGIGHPDSHLFEVPAINGAGFVGLEREVDHEGNRRPEECEEKAVWSSRAEGHVVNDKGRTGSRARASMPAVFGMSVPFG
jgi:hypothetical protein